KYKAGILPAKLENLFNPRILFLNTTKLHKYTGIATNINVLCRIGTEVPQHIQSDEGKIRHILTNLLHNAIKFAPPNSVVLVKCNVKNDSLLFSVKDSGEGVPKDMDIFAPFV